MMKWFLILLLSLGFYRADLNRDGRVDNLDLVIFSQEWLMADYALQFTDTGRVSIANAPDFGSTGFTIEFIARTSSGGTVFDSYDPSIGIRGIGIKIVLDNTGKPSVYVLRSVRLHPTPILPTGSFTADTWYYYCLVLDNSNKLNWYIDGAIRNEISGGRLIWPGSLAITETSKFIGANWNDDTSVFENFLIGDIKMFGYYTATALSADEVMARYIAGYFTGTETGLTWASNINNGSGLSVTDLISDNHGIINSLHYANWLDLSPAIPAEYLHKKVCEAIKTKFDAADFTYINSLYFEQAPQDAGLDYAVFHWIDSTERHLMGGTLESVTIQFNVYMIAVDDVGASIQELTDTFDWCNLTIPGYDHISMERESTRNMQYVDDVWQIVLTYDILVHY